MGKDKWSIIKRIFMGDIIIIDPNTLGTTGGNIADKKPMTLSIFAIKYKGKIKNDEIPKEYKKYLENPDDYIAEIEKEEKQERGGKNKTIIQRKELDKKIKKTKRIIKLIIVIIVILLGINYGTPLILEKYSEYRQKENEEEYRKIMIGVWKGYEENTLNPNRETEVLYIFLQRDDNYWNGYYDEIGEKAKILHWEINKNEITLDINQKGKEKYEILYISDKELVIKHNTEEVEVMVKTAERNLKSSEDKIKIDRIKFE